MCNFACSVMDKNAKFNQLLNNSIATYDKLLQPNVKCITSPFQGRRIHDCTYQQNGACLCPRFGQWMYHMLHLQRLAEWHEWNLGPPLWCSYHLSHLQMGQIHMNWCKWQEKSKIICLKSIEESTIEYRTRPMKLFKDHYEVFSTSHK